jgi:hypothetical protein
MSLISVLKAMFMFLPTFASAKKPKKQNPKLSCENLGLALTKVSS